MEFGDQGKKRESIGFSLSAADEKIKLIDICSDDGSDFLVASHSTNSLQDNVEKDYRQLRLPPLGVESSRPSLAWDAAFFNSSGFLDQHELSIINQGFKSQQESTSNKHKKVDCSSGSNKKSSRKEASVFSPNPAKALCRLRNSLMKPNKKDLVAKNEAKMEKTHTTPNSAARFSYSNPRSCPSHLKRMAQARNSEMSRIWRYSERTKLVTNSSSLSTGFHSKTGYDKEAIIMDYNDAKEAPNSLQETRDIFFSAAHECRPSGIRPPSPKIGFFDEKTPLISPGETKTRSNTTPRKVELQGTPIFDAKAHEFRRSRTDILASSACEKLKRNIKRLKAAHVNPPNATKIKEASTIKKKSEDASRKLSKYDPFLSQENGKKKACTDSRDQHGKLCRYFEAIDLKQDNWQQSSPSSNKNRTPLAEKTSAICDNSNTNLIWFGTT